jgi:dTDP-4-dehydrorhamnose reductase
MKLLITGAGGQLGRAMARVRVEGVDILGRTRAELDIADASSLARTLDQMRPDALINAAGFTDVRAAERARDLAFHINEAGARLVASATAAARIPLIHLSTDFVFDGAESRPYRPGDPTGPVNVYGESKLAGERAVLAADPGALVLRTSWLYWLGGRNFVTAIVGRLRGMEKADVVTDQRGSPTSAASLAALLILAAQRKVTGAPISGIRHFADEGVTSRYDFACAIREEAVAVGLVDPAASVVPTTGGTDEGVRRPAFSALDSGDVCRETGFPATPWRAALARAFREDRGLMAI